MNILIINNFSKHIDNLERAVKNEHKNTTTIHCLNFKKKDACNFDAVILSGGSLLPINNDHGIFNEQRSLIQNSNIPLLAICLGFQMLCVEFKSEMTSYYPNKIKGCFEIEQLENDSIFTGLENQQLNVIQAHYHSVTQTGNQLKILAKSKYGTEIVKHKQKNQYGFQFHPELELDKSNGHLLLRNFLQQLKNFKNEQSPSN